MSTNIPDGWVSLKLGTYDMGVISKDGARKAINQTEGLERRIEDATRPLPPGLEYSFASTLLLSIRPFAW